jgi:predicted O-methyltransferase YrrM
MRPEAVAPRAECPDPSRWEAPDKWASEVEVSRFLGALTALLKPTLVVETGTYHGDTAAEIGLALSVLQVGRLVSLEVDPARAALADVRCLGLPVTVVAGPSLSYVPAGQIDLLFLDSDFPIRIDELIHFRRWASPRCVIALHDTAVTYPGSDIMQTAMRGVVASHMIEPWLCLPTPRGLGLTRYR